jgi:hypothetical protein
MTSTLKKKNLSKMAIKDILKSNGLQIIAFFFSNRIVEIRTRKKQKKVAPFAFFASLVGCLEIILFF